MSKKILNKRLIQDEDSTSTIFAGISKLKPVINCRVNGQNITFLPEISVKVSTEKRGIHMSRLIESLLIGFFETEKCDVIENLGRNLAKYIEMRGNSIGLNKDFVINVECQGEYVYGLVEPCKVSISTTVRPNWIYNMIGVNLLCINACPCALSESDNKVTHTQNVDVGISIQDGEVSEIIKLIESNVTPTRSLLKRENEVRTIQEAYRNAMFVEDIVRKLDRVLKKKYEGQVRDWSVNVESIESIHKHHAIASILKVEG